MKKIGLLLLLTMGLLNLCISQNATELIHKVKAKINTVNNYIANGKMKTDITFIKAPIGKVTVYFKKPNPLFGILF